MRKRIFAASATAFVLGVGMATLATAGSHDNLLYADYPNNCLSCHQTQFTEMAGAMHYKWTGAAPNMINQPGVQQGKLTNEVNSYCINILGDWKICGKCHAGRGKKPDDPTAGQTNIDCLVCHSEEYAMKRDRLPDGSMGVAVPTDTMVRNIHKPTRANCLKCHANAGGGDAVKRGDLSMATITNADRNFDVHMNTTGANKTCQSCHVFKNHKVIGRGSDLRITDDLTRGDEVKCTTCHTNKNTSTGHGSTTTQLKIGRHASRNVACQTCHIPTYAKVATEIHRDWRYHHDGSPADGVSGPSHPLLTKGSNLIPEYKWWNRKSNNALLYDNAALTYDAALNTYPTSRPGGGFMDGKIYPFKYKTALQPMRDASQQLIALDTLEFIGVSGNVMTAVQKGLTNMGFSATDTWSWVTTDTYQLINHGVAPKTSALTCGTSSCHDGTGHTTTGRMPFDELGYHTQPAKVKSCTLCHEQKSLSWEAMHDKHRSKVKTCQGCHVKEPTGLIEPATPSGLCNNCHSGKTYYSSQLQSFHKEHTQKYACASCHTF